MEDYDGIRIALEGLQAMPPASDEFDARLGELRDALADHVREEERELFPRAVRSLGRAGLEQLAESIRTRQKALDRAARRA